MSKLSEWWNDLKRRADLKKSLQRELDATKPRVESLVDLAVESLVSEVQTGQLSHLSAQSLEGAILRAVGSLSLSPAVKAALTVVVSLAAPSLAVGIAEAAAGHADRLVANIRAEAERTKKKIRGARL